MYYTWYPTEPKTPKTGHGDGIIYHDSTIKSKKAKIGRMAKYYRMRGSPRFKYYVINGGFCRLCLGFLKDQDAGRERHYIKSQHGMSSFPKDIMDIYSQIEKIFDKAKR